MSAEIAELANAVVPYVTAAAGAYGSAVLTKLQEQSADATVRTGGSLLRRLLGKEQSAPALEAAVLDLAEDTEDPDRQGALRLQIRKLLAEDEELRAEISDVLKSAGATVTASGDRAVAAEAITDSVVSTGDDAQITQITR
ncbi:hypothetical protein [Saccharothrix luteola]|jgi:hypothetical protein|uniref:hypothetical protein n=1 Tax=Saccharothrix luteola TaxID=2893018 RepID=UPI001E5D696A|nr:hypothetical protein [Saccharothrix luteola]MCC8245549.1 hypothetical protein [Saccharothrix luteola]